MTDHSIATASSRLPWPLHTIDFEASSLDNGYPIEVGVCRWRSPEHPMEGWSSLIRPTPEWLADFEWNAQSAAVHGIDALELSEGLTPTEVIISLNGLLEGHAAFCDGGPFDLGWARTLAAASEVQPKIKIGDWDMLSGRLDPTSYERMVRWLDRSSIQHRARDDAERLMMALAIGLGTANVQIVDIIIGQ